VVALRVASGAASYADQPGLLETLIADWPRLPDGAIDPLYRVNRLNVASFVALQAGDTDQVQSIAQEVHRYGDQGSLVLAATVNRMLLGISHLWDGNPGLAQDILRGPLLKAERVQGRRSMIACLLASILAQALLELDQPEAAQLMLADRLDVIERTGFPDNILAAYGALAHAARARRDEAGAAAVLDGMEALARRRQLPRLRLHALAERIRLLALKGCGESVVGQLAELDSLADEFQDPALRPYLPQYRLAAAIAHAHAALAAGDLADADRWLDIAAAQAEAMHRRRDARAIKVLRAVVARRRGDRAAHVVLLEAVSLATLSGNARLLADTHPLALEMAAELDDVNLLLERMDVANEPDPESAAQASTLLTPKESEILGLLERGMSNKRIALVLGIGGETVKWHLKNLFSKLSAGSREHAVDRARLLGLMG
jgi:LuxR family maltose regulon positive regulatory protein